MAGYTPDDFNKIIQIRPILESESMVKTNNVLKYKNNGTVTLTPFFNSQTNLIERNLTEQDLNFLKEYDIDLSILNNKYTLLTDEQKKNNFYYSSQCSIILNTSEQSIDTSIINNFIMYRAILSSPYLYKSFSEIQSNTKYLATHYIHIEEEIVKEKANKIERKNLIISKIISLNKDEKIDLILFCTNLDVSLMSDENIIIKIEELKENNLNQIETYFGYSKEERTIYCFIIRCLNRKVINNISKDGYRYLDTKLGNSYKEVMDTLKINKELFNNIKKDLDKK